MRQSEKKSGRVNETGRNECHSFAQICDNDTRFYYLPRQVPFLVINSPNSLDRNVKSSDLARSFLTSLILTPLSPGEFPTASLSTCVRRTICSLCTALETVRSSRGNFSRKVISVLSSTVSSSLEKLKRMLICVLLSFGKKHSFS